MFVIMLGRPFCNDREDCSYGVVWLPIGVASCSLGREGLDAICPGICSFSPPGWGLDVTCPGICNFNPPSCGPLTGFALGDGGIARPNRGTLGPLPPLLPGIGGRSNGAGEDMLECVLMGSIDCVVWRG